MARQFRNLQAMYGFHIIDGQRPVNAIYAEVKAPLEQLFRVHLGPRNRQARQIRQYLKQGNEILQSVQQRRMA